MTNPMPKFWKRPGPNPDKIDCNSRDSAGVQKKAIFHYFHNPDIYQSRCHLWELECETLKGLRFNRSLCTGATAYIFCIRIIYFFFGRSKANSDGEISVACYCHDSIKSCLSNVVA